VNRSRDQNTTTSIFPPRGSVKERLELGTVRRLSAHVINKITPLPFLRLDKALHLKKLIIIAPPFRRRLRTTVTLCRISSCGREASGDSVGK
jgi:hypothetical protein